MDLEFRMFHSKYYVNMRNIHSILGFKSYSGWFESRVNQFDFKDGEDFVVVRYEGEEGRVRHHMVTIPTAVKVVENLSLTTPNRKEVLDHLKEVQQEYGTVDDIDEDYHELKRDFEKLERDLKSLESIPTFSSNKFQIERLRKIGIQKILSNSDRLKLSILDIEDVLDSLKI